MPDTALPRVTFYVLGHEQEATLREACLGALEQDYPNLELIFSDNGSTDRSFAIMREVAAGYRGPHAVRLNRNERNIGVIPHVNLVMSLASGELVVVSHGDDVSVPERTRALVDAWLASGRAAGAVHSAITLVDEQRRELGRREPPVRAVPAGSADAYALSKQLVVGAASAWSRRVLEPFGPIASAEAWDDLVFAFRALLTGPIAYVDRPLVRYRLGGMSTRPSGSGPAVWASWARRKLAVLEQRRADYAAIGRAPPPALDRQIAFERLSRDLLQGDWAAFVRGTRARPALLLRGAGPLARRVTAAALQLAVRARSPRRATPAP
jgi:glycosyltransferase involved in cell wall biosynthesis